MYYINVHLNFITVPPVPMNLTTVRFNSTTIGISWAKFTLVELKGLASYVITYNIIISSRKRQFGDTITVPWTSNSVIISNLQPGAQYDITVQTLTSAGMSGMLMHMREIDVLIVCNLCSTSKSSYRK